MKQRIPKAKGPDVRPSSPSINTPPNGKSTGKSSTATEAQERRILVALANGIAKTTDQLRALGCYQASARIFGLRKKGYNIVTELFNGWAADGFSHARMARYRLIGEPMERTGVSQ